MKPPYANWVERKRSDIHSERITASESGPGPCLNRKAALVQAVHIPNARHRAAADVRKLIDTHTVALLPGLSGFAMVNAVELYLALDAAIE